MMEMEGKETTKQREKLQQSFKEHFEKKNLILSYKSNLIFLKLKEINFQQEILFNDAIFCVNSIQNDDSLRAGVQIFFWENYLQKKFFSFVSFVEKNGKYPTDRDSLKHFDLSIDVCCFFVQKVLDLLTDVCSLVDVDHLEFFEESKDPNTFPAFEGNIIFLKNFKIFLCFFFILFLFYFFHFFFFIFFLFFD